MMCVGGGAGRGVVGTGSEEPSSNKGETQENVLVVTSCGTCMLTGDIGDG